MKKIRIISVLVLATVLAFSLSLNALAESVGEETQNSSTGNETVMFVIAAVLVILAVISVVLVNKKTKKYRQAFKKRKKKK